MALVNLTVQVAYLRSWKNPETGFEYQIVEGWEKYQNHKNEPKNRKWSLWLDVKQDLGEGDVITVTGELTTQIDKYSKDGDERTVVAHSLNSVSITSQDTKFRRGGDLLGQDQDDVIKYGHPTYSTEDVPF